MRTPYDSRTTVVAALAVLVLAGAALSVLVRAPRSDDALPVVRILEPSSGVGVDAPLVVAPGRAVAVRGVVLHATPIAELRIAGRRLAADFAADRMAAEFSGYVDASDLRRDGSVDIEVVALNGERAERRIPARLAAARDAAGPPGFADVAGSDRRQRWAVVIGAGTFGDPGIGARPGVERDARAFAAFLRSPAAGLDGLPPGNLRILTGDDATARSVRSALTTFLRATTPDDLVLVYLAGRALPDPHRPGPVYFLTRDTELDDLPATAVSLDFIQRAIADTYAANRIVLVDAGAHLDRALVDRAHARHGGLVVLAAAGREARAGHRSHHSDDAFGRALRGALAGAADSDGDGIVRIAELTAHLPGTSSATSHDRHLPLAAVTPGRTVAEP